MRAEKAGLGLEARIPWQPWIRLSQLRARDREAKMCKVDVLRVLDRAADDNAFIGQLTDQPSRALEGYSLTLKERAALLGGDLNWIEGHVCRLNGRLRTWLMCRLQQEAW